MHQKKISKFLRTFLEKYHSIPILLRKSSRNKLNNKLSKNNLRYVSYGIPIGCMVALLLSLCSGTVYADTNITTCDPVEVEGYALNDACELVPVLTTPTTHQPSLTLSIDGSNSDISDRVVAGYGESSYSSHTVSVKASNIKSYSIVMSSSGLTGPSSIGSANNLKCSSLAENTWGYGWENTAVNDEDAICKAVNSSISLSGDAVNKSAVDFSKKLVFAVKFGEDANPGVYNAKVNLSVVATPLDVVDYVDWNKMVYMQDMSTEACENTTPGPTKTLIDVRDNSTYTVAKLSSGNCWMTQNLRITGDSMKGGLNKTTTKYDSDVDRDFVMPVSMASGFYGSDNNKVYYSGNIAYGSYYSWYAATAGTGTSSSANGNIATSSICPKGWRLPTREEYAALATKTSVWGSLNFSSVSYNGKFIGGDSSSGVFWPAPGYYGNNTPYQVGIDGRYWSSTADKDGKAHFLFFNEGVLGVTSDHRYIGYPVRCIAR